MDKKILAKMIDHTILKPEATEEQIKLLCEEAKAYGFASVCVNPAYVELCSKLLIDSNVKVCTVIGFPLGANTTRVKVFETEEAIENGAEEVDMVINIGKFKDRDIEYVKKDISEVVKAARGKAITKVIIETCLLTKEEIILASSLTKEAGADFVKTSTGFSSAGAKAEDIRTMRETVGENMGIKASGGIRTYEACIEMIEAGATRIGASASVEICRE